MRRLRMAAGAFVVAVVAVAAHPAAGAAGGASPSFDVGAATVDITPPAPGGATDIATTGCSPVGGSGPFTGKRQFGLEEPYADLNGNGHYDAPDPANGVSGEPFLDCPTATASGSTRPPDGRWDGIYVGGGDCCDRLADGTVFDRISATAVVVARSGRRIALVSADNEGVFKEIWDQVRAKVAADGTHLDAVFPSSTHDESAPDTIGITGPTQTTSAVDPFYVEFFVGRVAAAVEQAAAHVQPARLRYGSIHPDDLVPCWSSYPYVADENVGVLQATATSTGRVLATVVNYGIHAEELGFDPATRRVISGDWWHFLRTSLQQRYGAAPVLAMAGPVGSVEMPMILTGAHDPVPTGVHKYSSRDGCTTIYSGPPERVRHEGGYTTYTKTLGEVVADWAVKALAAGADSSDGTLRFERRTIFAPVDNALFLAAAPLCVFDYRILYVNGVPTGTGIPPACGAGTQLKTDVGWLQIGDGTFTTAPGELFPSTYDHDFHGVADVPAPSTGAVHGWVTARAGGRWRFVDGLGEDLSGYIFPANNEVGTPSATNPNGDDVDRFNCHHVDDGEASSGNEGDVVDDALMALLPGSAGDRVVAGRYVYSDGTLHRDPTGDGRLGCDAASARFRPAPGGGAVAVYAAGHLYRPGQFRWMDLRAVPQQHPDQQTRGVLLPSGERLWLDVWPEVATQRVSLAGGSGESGAGGSGAGSAGLRALPATGAGAALPLLGVALLVVAVVVRGRRPHKG